nr:hypothetical protein [Tanacetum cinerariifolium]
MYRASNLDSIKILTKELKEVKLEKDGLDGKLAGLLKASKNLDHLIESQRPSPTVESTSAEGQNKNSTTAENGESTDSILSKHVVKFVKAAERPTTDKVEPRRSLLRAPRSKMNFARPNKPAHSYGRRPFQDRSLEV